MQADMDQTLFQRREYQSALWRGVRPRSYVHRQLHVWCSVDHRRVVARGVHKGLAGRVVGYKVLARRDALGLACGRWGAWQQLSA